MYGVVRGQRAHLGEDVPVQILVELVEGPGGGAGGVGVGENRGSSIRLVLLFVLKTQIFVVPVVETCDDYGGLVR